MNYSKIPKTLHQNDNVVVFLDMMVSRRSRTFGFISIIASFLSNLYRSDGEGYLTLADIGDEWSLQGLVRLSPGRMNKTSTKLKFHLLVLLFRYRQDKMLYTTVFCALRNVEEIKQIMKFIFRFVLELFSIFSKSRMVEFCLFLC